MSNTQRQASRAQIVTAFAAVYLVWGSTYLAIRYAVQTLPPLLMGGARFMFAGAVLYAWCRVRERHPRPTRKGWLWATFAGALLLGGGNGSVVWAETRVPSGATALIVATVALWIVVLEWVRPGGKRPAPLVMVGVLLGLGGVALLVGPRGLGAGIDPLGALVLTLASLSWAAGSLAARSPRMPGPSLLGASMQMITGGGVLLVGGLVSGEASRLNWSAVSGTSLIALAYLVVFGSLIGYTAYIWLVGHVAPTRAATYAYVNPVIAVLLGWAIAGEPLTAWVMLASAVIVGAVALVTIGQGRQRAAAAAESVRRRDAA